VSEAGITAPLMIMRSDGGVMSIDEVRRRPILTILSGPAAGVAAALMYAKISDGIFIEVGGTSSDITCIRNGQASVQSATIGGHKLFLRTLDVRTIGLAGGSMIRLRDGKLFGVGPRSAHLAGLAYSCFSSPPVESVLATIRPCPNDPDDYAVAVAPDGARVALTMTCAANAAGLVPAGDYAAGDGAVAGQLLAAALHTPPAAAATAVQEAGCALAVATIEQLLADYGLRHEHVTLIGGGGGAGAVAPGVGKLMALPWRIAENAPVISAIGVALALVRDTVERSIMNPTKDDLLRVRREAIDAVVRVGANPETVEVQVEVDPQRQTVRAIATGASELRARDLSGPALADDARREHAARSLGVSVTEVRELARTPNMVALSCLQETKKLFGLVKTRKTPLRLVDRDGVIRLQLAHGEAEARQAAQAPTRLREMIAAQAHYDDGGERLPAVFLLAGPRIVNLSGLLSVEQIISLAEAELENLPAEEMVLLIVGKS
jgi:N-methylhydantoinase A/oxoprolinase/acetone carboxylase beta subunit